MASHRTAVAGVSAIAIGVFTGATGAQESLRITDGGVGQVTAETPFAVSEIQALFPGHAARASVGMTEGMEIPIIEVRADENLVLTLTPTFGGEQVFSVIVHRTGATDGFGGRIGASYGSIYGDQSADSQSANNCLPGIEELSGAVFCPAPGAERVWYVLRGVWAGPDGSVPPLDALASWTVGEIVWMRRAVQRGCWWSACAM